MEIDPGWHVYWKYPGETGLPTRVEFSTPHGFKAGELMWPIPMAFKKYEGGIEYGYENSLLLWTNIEVPQDTELNPDFEIDAAVSMKIDYHKPTPINKDVTLKAKVTMREGRKLLVACKLFSGEDKCASAEVLAVKVPPENWFD